jgi:hypothetical protein
MHVKVSSCCEEKKKIPVTVVALQHAIWAKSGAERQGVPFNGKSGTNIGLEDPSRVTLWNILSCFVHQKLWKQ